MILLCVPLINFWQKIIHILWWQNWLGHQTSLVISYLNLTFKELFCARSFAKQILLKRPEKGTKIRITFIFLVLHMLMPFCSVYVEENIKSWNIRCHETCMFVFLMWLEQLECDLECTDLCAVLAWYWWNCSPLFSHDILCCDVKFFNMMHGYAGGNICSKSTREIRCPGWYCWLFRKSSFAG